MPSQMMNPPFRLQLPHHSINSWKPCHPIFPFLEQVHISGPHYLLTFWIFDHFVEIGSFVRNQIEEFSEEELTMQRLRRKRMAFVSVVDGLDSPEEGSGA